MSLRNHRVNYEELKLRSTEDLQGELLYYAPEATRARRQAEESLDYQGLIEEARDAIAAELQRRSEGMMGTIAPGLPAIRLAPRKEGSK